MGCGKTTIGKELAKKLKYEFIDLDEWIEKKSRSSIAKIFEKHGENYFRKKETDALKKTSKLKKKVIATGGGAPCFNENMELMNKTGITVYIEMPAGALFHRLSNSKPNRPLIAGMLDSELMEFIMYTLPQREVFYSNARITVNGMKMDIKKLVGQIKEEIGEI